MSPTIRQTIVRLLEERELSAQDLADLLLLTRREVQEHLPHLQRSLKKALHVRPALCRRCGFVFRDRARLDTPGRCPRCRSELVDGPWFSLET